MASQLQEWLPVLREAPASRLLFFIGAPFIGLGVGYFWGAAKVRTVETTSGTKYKTIVHLEDEQGDQDDEEDEEYQEINGLTSPNEECKLVLVVRTDLGMTKGKIAAQCSHATLACYKCLTAARPDIIKRWERLGQAKVAVQVRGEDELELLKAKAISLGICAKVIHDAGRTQIAAGSATVLGVGPAEKSKVDMITGHLKLL